MKERLAMLGFEPVGSTPEQFADQIRFEIENWGDNDGEGGILALMALLGVKREKRPAIVALGLFGAALIYGDGAITPAISVLSALEGLTIAAPGVGPYVVPTAVAILIALFAIQSQGTARIGHAFGPVMAAWFA